MPDRSAVIRGGMFVLGLSVMAFGCYLTIQAGLGVAPWDTFHIGLQKTFGLTIGLWSDIVGVAVIILSYLIARVKPGIWTLTNIVWFGGALDGYIWLGLVPASDSLLAKWLLFACGMLIMAFGIGSTSLHASVPVRATV